MFTVNKNKIECLQRDDHKYKSISKQSTLKFIDSFGWFVGSNVSILCSILGIEGILEISIYVLYNEGKRWKNFRLKYRFQRLFSELFLEDITMKVLPSQNAIPYSTKNI